MGLFKGKGIKGKKASEGGTWILPGNYRVKIKRCLAHRSQKNKAQVFFIANLGIEESDNEERKVGTEMSFSADVTTPEYVDVSLGNINALLYAAFSSMALSKGEEPPGEDDIDDDMADWSISEENPLMGVELDLYAYTIKTKAGNDFTKCKWSVPEDVKEAAKAA